jgi:two-component system OmpR family sensor kinase
MAELQGTDAEEVHDTVNKNVSSQNLYVVDLLAKRVPSTPLFENTRALKNTAPSWLRPFFSLRTQLTTVYFFILCIVVLVLCVLYNQHVSMMYIGFIALGAIILGTVLVFLLNTLLLQSLWRVTDAAQAIATGDLKQRERLPLRLPPQDEIDRLAGSLNEMVTRLERAEEMQLASELRFRRFFSDASHQLRTPLTSLRGFTEVLMRGAKDDPEMSARVLKLMKSEAERMTLLINDLLILARLDDSRPIKKEYIDLLALATEEIEKTRLRAKDARPISLSILTEKRLDLKGDPERIHQLFFVLLDNALLYGRPAPEGAIRIELDHEDEFSVIRVIDNGEGIASHDLAHIFDAFYRVQSKRNSHGTNPTGTGLGLTIAAAIVRAHAGTISVYSESGKGTTFTVKLPCVE